MSLFLIFGCIFDIFIKYRKILHLILKKIIWLSLYLNIAVLIPVCFGILSGQEFVSRGWGMAQPSLYLLLSIYCTIFIASFYLLIRPNLYLIFSLLSMQVIYKMLSPIFVGSLQNPVVISNLAIAAVHLVSLYGIVKSPQFSLDNSLKL
jgi:hypothetical protein